MDESVRDLRCKRVSCDFFVSLKRFGELNDALTQLQIFSPERAEVQPETLRNHRDVGVCFVVSGVVDYRVGFDEPSVEVVLEEFVAHWGGAEDTGVAGINPRLARRCRDERSEFGRLRHNAESSRAAWSAS